MKVQYHALYILVILFFLTCDRSQISTKYATDYVTKYDTIRSVITNDNFVDVVVYQSDTVRLLDTLKMRDTVYILRDWSTPKVYTNNYSDSNYSLTVIDSIQFNQLKRQIVDIEIRNKTVYTNKSELWVLYQAPVIPSLMYRHRSGVSVLGGYDVLNRNPILGVGLKIK